MEQWKKVNKYLSKTQGFSAQGTKAKGNRAQVFTLCKLTHEAGDAPLSSSLSSSGNSLQKPMQFGQVKMETVCLSYKWHLLPGE